MPISCINLVVIHMPIDGERLNVSITFTVSIFNYYIIYEYITGVMWINIWKAWGTGIKVLHTFEQLYLHNVFSDDYLCTY